MGEVTESGGKKKLSNIRAPMEGGKLMCEVELEDGLVRLDRLGSAPDGEEVRPGRQDSAPDGEDVSAPVDGHVRQGSAPVRSGRPEGGRGPNRGRRDA